jgi:hypothetical protein
MAHTETTKAINRYATRMTRKISNELSHDEFCTDKTAATEKHIMSITPDR